MRYVIVSTIRRGSVNPPEPLDLDNQRMVDAVIAWDTARAEREGAQPMSQWRSAMDAKKPPKGDYIYGPAQRVLMKAMGR